MVDETVAAKARAAQLGRLWWLVDAPLFVDNSLVERFHDAIVWPASSDEKVEQGQFNKARTLLDGTGKLEGGAELSAPDFIKWLAPKLEAKGALEGRVTREGEKQDFSFTTGRPIRSAERLLNELVIEYLKNFPNRILFVDVPVGQYSNLEGPVERAAVEQLLNSPPRPLVFVGVKERSAILPTMVEMEQGGFEPIYKTLEEKFLGLGSNTKYPDDDAADADDKRRAYWDALKRGFKSRVAMQELEERCESGRIGWVDFRVLFSAAGETAHLHVVPGGKYHAGVFGYNFVHRAYRYGCRIVGSLKSGNDINVLAIYER